MTKTGTEIQGVSSSATVKTQKGCEGCFSTHAWSAEVIFCSTKKDEQ